MVSTPVPENLFFDFYIASSFFVFIMVNQFIIAPDPCVSSRGPFTNSGASNASTQSTTSSFRSKTMQECEERKRAEDKRNNSNTDLNQNLDQLSCLSRLYSFCVDNLSMYIIFLYLVLGAFAFGYMTFKTTCLQHMSVHTFYVLFYLVLTVIPLSFKSSKFLIIFFLVSCGYMAHKLDNNTDAYTRNIDTQQGNTVLLNEFFVALQKRSGDSHTTPFHVGLALHKLVYACTHKDEFMWDQCTEELSNGERVVKTFYRALEDVVTSDKLFDPKFTSYVEEAQYNVNSFRKKSAMTNYTQLELRSDLSVLGVSRLIVGQEYERKIESLGRGLFNGNMIYDMIDNTATAFQIFGFIPSLKNHINIMTGFNTFKAAMHMIAKHGKVCLYEFCIENGLYGHEIEVLQVIRLNDTCIAQFCYNHTFVKQPVQNQTTVEILVNKTVNQSTPEKPVERSEKTYSNPLTMKCNYTKEYCLANFPVQLKSNWMNFVSGAFTEPEVVLQPVSPIVNLQWPKSYPNQTIMNVHIKCNYTLDFCLEHFPVELKPTSFQQSYDMVQSAIHGGVVVAGCIYALLGLGA